MLEKSKWNFPPPRGRDGERVFKFIGVGESSNFSIKRSFVEISEIPLSNNVVGGSLKTVYEHRRRDHFYRWHLRRIITIEKRKRWFVNSVADVSFNAFVRLFFPFMTRGTVIFSKKKKLKKWKNWEKEFSGFFFAYKRSIQVSSHRCASLFLFAFFTFSISFPFANLSKILYWDNTIYIVVRNFDFCSV